MHCELLNVGGHQVIVCGTRRGQPACIYCRQPSTRLCDAPVPRELNGWKFANATCDVPLCDSCTTSGEPGKDYCRTHRDIGLAAAAAKTGGPTP